MLLVDLTFLFREQDHSGHCAKLLKLYYYGSIIIISLYYYGNMQQVHIIMETYNKLQSVCLQKGFTIIYVQTHFNHEKLTNVMWIYKTFTNIKINFAEVDPPKCTHMFGSHTYTCTKIGQLVDSFMIESYNFIFLYIHFY